MPSTIRLHRVFGASPDKVYRAFLDADAKVKWLPPHDFTGKVHHIDARVGGTYHEIVPGERLRYSDRFDDANLPGEMHVKVELKKVSVGTEISIVQDGVPDVMPAEARYLGWQQLLNLLAQLVEPDIRD